MAAKLIWLECRVSDRKVANSMPVLGLNANYLTGSLCDEKDQHKYLFRNGLHWRKKMK